MFKIKHISECYCDPIACACEIGKFDGPRTSQADLVFVREGIDSTRTYMNSEVLRELLLSNPDLLATATGLVCVDIDKYNNLVESYNQLVAENKKLKKKSKRDKEVEDMGGIE